MSVPISISIPKSLKNPWESESIYSKRLQIFQYLIQTYPDENPEMLSMLAHCKLNSILYAVTYPPDISSYLEEIPM